MKARLSLGLDSSTQSLTAVAIDMETGDTVASLSVDYAAETELLRYGLDAREYLVPPRVRGEADQPPKLYLASLELLFGRLKERGFDFSAVAAVNVSGQQHGHLYLNRKAHDALGALRSEGSGAGDLVGLLGDIFAYGTAPIWKTSNTARQATEIRSRMGGKRTLIEASGSDSPLRFTGTVIRRVAQEFPEAYAETDLIHLISSFIPAVLCGDAGVPWDFGNGCGTSLMDYRRREFSPELLEAVGGDLPGGTEALRAKLPGLAAPTAVAGRVAAHFIEKYGFAPDCAVLAGSGDNPQTKVLVSGDLLSLGSSFVFMVGTDGKSVDREGYANAMYDGLGRPFMFGCRTNGAMVWDRVRAASGMKKEEYGPAERALAETSPGSSLFMWQPFDESFPLSPAFEAIRRGYQGPDFALDYAGIIDSSLAAIYLYSAGFSAATTEPLYVTGGPASSRQILRRIAAIWKRPAVPIGSVGAALGCAVAGAVGAARETEREIDVEGLTERVLPRGEAVLPCADDVAAYHDDGGYLERLREALAG
jgi:xylulokinase